jgi:hypothetical protein
MCQRRKLDRVILATVQAGGMGVGPKSLKMHLGSVLRNDSFWSPGLSVWVDAGGLSLLLSV